MTNLMIAIVVSALILGGPLTLFAIIKIASGLFGSPKVRVARLKEAPFAVAVEWDNESYPLEVFRVRVDYAELVQGGRATSFSVTFADKASKKKSFVVPIQLSDADLALLTDSKLDARTLSRSQVVIEIETADNQARRIKLSKKQLLEALDRGPWIPSKEFEVAAPVKPDDWSLLTRVFPWRKAAAASAASAPKDAAAAGAVKPAPVKSEAPQIADFIVTKVWIEPGCIVCDACENEAPEVFQVNADTCIVKPDADLSKPLSIKAAAEGCPVNVIKFDTKPAA